MDNQLTLTACPDCREAGNIFDNKEMDRYMQEDLSPHEMVKKAEEIAIHAHFHQPYGSYQGNGAYYKYHLDVVRKFAVRLAKKYSSLPTYKFEIAALLHDYLEDTHPAGEEIENLKNLFGNELLESVERLAYRYEKSYEEYFKAISEDEVAKVVKAADRVANISALKDIEDQNRRKELFQKYVMQFEFFERYNIFPEVIEEAFEFLIL